jgi:LmbE family N-acetylglucosaminyl deacetylase
MRQITLAARRVAATVAFGLLLVPAARAQQLPPAGTGGIGVLYHALLGLDQNRRVLVIGAHPDDEDTELLTYLSRGTGADVAYLSLSRGEGGQNLIGTELGEALGLLRSEELLSARTVDGAHQYFSRAFDFGFSKTLAETLRFWPRDTLLVDVLRVIRRFRPQVLVSIFSGTPRDGHGQHQAAGMVARAAFDALRDSSWGPRKLYQATRFDTAATTVVLASGGLDPIAGESFHQVAMADRSLHRSQEMGRLQDIGPSVARLGLIDEAGPGARSAAADPSAGLFAGIDTSLAPGLERYAALIDSARAALTPADPARVVPLIAAALAELRRAAPEGFRTRKEPVLEQALCAAAGVVVDAYSDDGRLVPGERFAVTTALWNAGSLEARLDSVTLDVPAGWMVQPTSEAPPRARGFFSASARGVAWRRFQVTVSDSAPLWQPYFMVRPQIGDLYDWSGQPPDVLGEPFQLPPVFARLDATVAGVPVSLRREVAYRYDDEARGEVRRPLFVVPAVGVEISPTEMVWPIAAGGTRTVTVTLTNGRRSRTEGDVGLELPPGWPAVAAQRFALEGEDTRRSFTFEVHAPRAAAAGRYRLRAVARTSGDRFDRGSFLVDYSHIRPMAYVREAMLTAELANLALPRVARIGYVRGAADLVPEALQAVGLPITLLSRDDLEKGDLSRFDVIVIGPRAYETDLGLIAANGRLLDYARRGGRLIVQYQQYRFVSGQYAPFPFAIARPHDRVTDETAPVTVLEPRSALFRAPNAIGPADWDGWVQERGLYFAHTWDPAYRPMLETGDAGERLRGGLLAARLGRGLYVYTGLSFFRQLPAGVPGAFRLFANLLALRPQDIQ